MSSSTHYRRSASLVCVRYCESKQRLPDACYCRALTILGTRRHRARVVLTVIPVGLLTSTLGGGDAPATIQGAQIGSQGDLSSACLWTSGLAAAFPQRTCTAPGTACQGQRCRTRRSVAEIRKGRRSFERRRVAASSPERGRRGASRDLPRRIGHIQLAGFLMPAPLQLHFCCYNLRPTWGAGRRSPPRMRATLLTTGCPWRTGYPCWTTIPWRHPERMNTGTETAIRRWAALVVWPSCSSCTPSRGKMLRGGSSACGGQPGMKGEPMRKGGNWGRSPGKDEPPSNLYH